MDHNRIIATVRGTEAERATIQVAAQRAGMSLSQYLRYKLDLTYTTKIPLQAYAPPANEE